MGWQARKQASGQWRSEANVPTDPATTGGTTTTRANQLKPGSLPLSLSAQKAIAAVTSGRTQLSSLDEGRGHGGKRERIWVVTFGYASLPKSGPKIIIANGYFGCNERRWMK